MIDYIQSQLPREELLAQLAEEAAELSKASLKLRRCLDGKNPTPVTESDAWANLLEEVADVMLCLTVLGVSVNLDEYSDAINTKLARWNNRLHEMQTGQGYEEKTESGLIEEE